MALQVSELINSLRYLVTNHIKRKIQYTFSKRIKKLLESFLERQDFNLRNGFVLNDLFYPELVVLVVLISLVPWGAIVVIRLRNIKHQLL